jgi:WD40 repeat protein
LEGHTAVVWDVAFLPDGKKALTGSWDGTLILWDLETGAILKHMIEHTAEIHGVAVSPDGRRAISASADGTLILWDLESGQAIRRYYGHAWELRNVAFSPDGLTAVSAGRDMQMIHWRIDRTLDELLVWTRANRYVRDLTCPERELYGVEPLCDR